MLVASTVHRIVYGARWRLQQQAEPGRPHSVTPPTLARVRQDLAGRQELPTRRSTQLQIDTISSVGPQQSTERTLPGCYPDMVLWRSCGTGSFCLARRTPCSSTGKARSISTSLFPPSSPSTPTTTRVHTPPEADYPETGALGQWIIDSTDNTTLVWDPEGVSWVATGSGADAPTAAVQELSFPVRLQLLRWIWLRLRQCLPCWQVAEHS